MSGERPFDLADYLASARAGVESVLEDLLPAEANCPPVIHQAMRYSLFAGGKRLRPILALAAAESVGGRRADVLAAACALEMIHTYSLIHDDLPAMDDDDLRRGRPTCHKVYGEAVAILAGDALLTLAFEVLARSLVQIGCNAEQGLLVLAEVARASGTKGLIGGQVLDLEFEGREIDRVTLEDIESRKTGALFDACLRLGGRLGGATGHQLNLLSEFGRYFGLAFQISDDILDVVGDPAVMGKAAGSDARKRKATFTVLLGLEAAGREARRYAEKAVGCLGEMGPAAEPLRALGWYAVSRQF